MTAKRPSSSPLQRLSTLIAFAAFAAMALSSAAAQAAPLAPTLTAFHAVDRQWTPLHKGDMLNTGDQVLFKINYLNGDWSPAPAGDVFFSVPSEVTLTSIDDAHAAVFSVDGGKSFDQLNRLRVYKSGRWVPAQMGDVTHIRWRVSHAIDAGGGDTFTAHAVRE